MKSKLTYEDFLIQLYPTVDGNVQMLIERALKNIGGIIKDEDGQWIRLHRKCRKG